MTDLTDADDEVSYKTDEFGRPDDRDYHYRIPLNDDRAFRLATWALHSMVHYDDRFVVEWDGYSGSQLSYMGIRTRDSKGHLRGLAEFAHSPRWKNVETPLTEVDEYRQNPAGGGTKIKGTFRASPVDPHAEVRLTFETVVDLTPTEFETALENGGGTLWEDEVRDPIHYAKQDAIEDYVEAYVERQRECEHRHVVDDAASYALDSPDAVAYCEDCHAELDEDGDVVA